MLRDDGSRRTAIGAEFPVCARAMLVAGSVGDHHNARPESDEAVVPRVRPSADVDSGSDVHLDVAIARSEKRNRDRECDTQQGYASARATISAVTAPTMLHSTFTASLLNHATPPACTVYAPQE